MKSIGDQVRDYRNSHTPVMPPAELAKKIGGKVKRQHIEQLEAAGNRIPKYLGDLAAVMGTTADQMLAAAGLSKAVSRPAKPPAQAKGAVFEALSTEELELLAHWRRLLGSDRRSKLKDIAKLAKIREAERKELFEEAGLTAIAERAAHASRGRTARSSVEPTDALRQRSLIDDEPKR